MIILFQTHFHEKILEDEGVMNIEISMDLLAGKAAEHARKSKKMSKYGSMVSVTPPPNEYKTSISPNKSSKNIAADSIKSMTSLDPEIIVEKSEVDSNAGSSAKNTPRGDHDSHELVNIDPSRAPSREGSVSIMGKAFVKKDDQYYIEEIKRDQSSMHQTIDSNQNPGPGFIQDIQDVEDVLFEIQNTYSNLDIKVKDQISRFTSEMNNKFNELSKAIEFTNNQMNVYMQMMNTDIDIIKLSNMP